jgi:catechol 2,3-dioxygenase-like lactoylglutathione lyase family enzyme
MLVGRLHHASFPVRDLDKSKHFYGEVLGLEEIDRPDFGFAGAWYSAGRGSGCEVHLIVPDDGFGDIGAAPSGLNPMAVHTAFAIDDYDRAVERFASHDVEVLGFGRDAGQMWVKDPDGNMIELIVPPDPKNT